MKVTVERTAKRIVRIKVSGGQVFVTAHKSLSLAEIKEIVESRREWINAAAGVAADSLPEKEERSGASAANMADMFCGRKCLICGETLEVKSTTGSKGYVDGGTVYLPQAQCDKNQRLQALRALIKRLSKQHVSVDVAHFGSKISCCATRIEFKSLGASWVRCSNPREKAVVLDYRICQLPEKLQQYLIAHAFVHFRCDGHERDFWQEMSKFFPDYDAMERELGRYAFLKEI